MKNGIYAVDIKMLDGVKASATGVMLLKDGKLLAADSYFWTVGSYTFKDGRWKGDMVTNQFAPTKAAKPLFGGREVSTGFSGTYANDEAEVYASSLVGKISISFHATLKYLSDW
jgi:hypothetical protein